LGGIVAGAMLAPGIAHSQSRKRIVAMSFGGGVNTMWRSAFARPFTSRTGIDVDIIDASDPGAQVRVHAARPVHDIVTATYVDAVNLNKDGLIETFPVSDLPAISLTPKSYWLQSSNGQLLGAPVYRTFYGIAYNTDLVKAGEIRSWKDLAEPRWKGKIAIARPVFGSVYDLTAYAFRS
jgi:putative spermidine/putrescine transport system substrate-binding protein